jgi:hypothetical protein
MPVKTKRYLIGRVMKQFEDMENHNK